MIIWLRKYMENVIVNSVKLFIELFLLIRQQHLKNLWERCNFSSPQAISQTPLCNHLGFQSPQVRRISDSYQHFTAGEIEAEDLTEGSAVSYRKSWNWSLGLLSPCPGFFPIYHSAFIYLGAVCTCT